MMIHSQLRADQEIPPHPDAILLATVLAEVRASATQAQERGFLLAVGHRLAATFPLTNVVELDALENGMSDVLRRIGAGTVCLSVDADGIGIEHIAARREGVAPDIIEGLYAGWFATLGNDKLVLRRLDAAADRLIFHYGR